MLTLRWYQEPIKTQAIEILDRSGFVYLVMAPRTGKTPTTFSIIQHSEAQRAFLLTTKGAKPGIKKTFKKCKPGFKLDLHHYDQLAKLLEDANWAPKTPYIIIDEGHLEGAFPEPSLRATNTREMVLRAYRKFGPEVKVIFLSGTPSPEDYVQLYHQFNCLGNRNPFGDIENFMNHYVDKSITKIYRKPQPPIEIPVYKAKQNLVLELIRPYYISLTQEQAGFKQKVQEQTRTVNMQLATNKYIHELTNRNQTVINGIDIPGGSAANLKSKIHQLSGGTIKYDIPLPKPTTRKDGRLPVSAKTKSAFFILDYTKALYIKEHFGNHKIAIYYKFKAELELLKQVFPNWTNSDDEFNESSDKVYLGQFVSKREGVDLNTADYLIMYNIDYAALSYWQTIQRHNFDTRETPCHVVWVFSKNGIESHIYPKVMNKKNYTTSYFEHDLTFIKKQKPNQLDLFA